MLILSKHHDYYDGVARTGIDKSIVYKRLIRTFRRKPSRISGGDTDSDTFVEVEKDSYGRYEVLRKGLELELPVLGISSLRHLSFSNNDNLLGRGVLLMCGKAYPYGMIRVFKGISKLPDWDRREYKVDTFFEDEGANKALVAAYNDLLEFGNIRHNWERSRIQKMVDTYDYSKSILPTTGNLSKETLLGIHRNLASPIIDISAEYVQTNINLKKMQFQRVMDPYTAFQEISMFIGGVLGNPEKETLSITDKDRIQQHGFDKWSFRKLPEKNNVTN